MNLWPFNSKPRGPIVATDAAREAIGIADPATQGYAAVRLALEQATVMDDAPQTDLPHVEITSITVSEVVTRAARLSHLKKNGPTTEYHGAIAAGILDDLVGEVAKIESDIAEHERSSAEWVKKLRHDIAEYERDTATKTTNMRKDLADKHRAIAFWRTAPEYLGGDQPKPEPEQAALPKPKRVRKRVNGVITRVAENPPA